MSHGVPSAAGGAVASLGRTGGRDRMSLLLAVFVVGAIAALVLPVPPPLLDFLIALNLAGSIAILLATLFANDAARLSAFPTILLLATLFRLALNVSSTRLLLLTGDAGRIIHSFGEFVVGGNYVVGGAVFAVLVTIQFLVVAKGSDRASEVRGRFTLDRQQIDSMRIDAELRQGTATVAEAKARHDRLDVTSEMAASMTGSLKFVKGDTIAGLVITAVNIVGGLIVGVLHMGQSIGDAARHFTTLTIADALVQQIPSMLITIAAGTVVTRVYSRRGGVESGLGADIFEQILRQPRPMAVTGALLLLLAATGGKTGLPPIQCGALGVGAIALAVACRRRAEGGGGPAALAARTATAARDAGGIEVLLAVGPDLQSVFYAGDQLRPEFCAGAARVIARVRDEMGIHCPPIGLTAAPAGLDARGYQFRIRGSLAGGGRLDEAHAAFCTLARAREVGVDGRVARLAGWPVDVVLVDAAAATQLQAAGIAVRSPLELVLDHVERLLRGAGRRFLGLQETRNLLSSLQASCPDLVNAAERAPGLPQLTAVLQQLLDEQIAIVDLRAILGAVVDAAQDEAAGVPEFVDAARLAVSARTCDRLTVAGDVVCFYRLAPLLEQRLCLGGGHLAPADLERLRASVRTVIDFTRHLAVPPVVVVDPVARRAATRVFAKALPEAVVLSIAECAPQYRAKQLGVLGEGFVPQLLSPLDDPAMAASA